MAQPDTKSNDGANPAQKEDAERELDDGELDQVSGGKESQVFSSVSNVLKTRHDTVKNSVGN